jgi:hypothetical protein
MLFAAALLTAGQVAAADKAGRYGANPENLEPHLKRLVEAYPGVVKGYDKDALILANGKRLPLSDGRTDKTFDELLDSPDMGDMFVFAYPAGAEPSAPARNVDPGRIPRRSAVRSPVWRLRKGAGGQQAAVYSLGAASWRRNFEDISSTGRRQGA